MTKDEVHKWSILIAGLLLAVACTVILILVKLSPPDKTEDTWVRIEKSTFINSVMTTYEYGYNKGQHDCLKDGYQRSRSQFKLDSIKLRAAYAKTLE